MPPINSPFSECNPFFLGVFRKTYQSITPYKIDFSAYLASLQLMPGALAADLLDPAGTQINLLVGAGNVSVNSQVSDSKSSYFTLVNGQPGERAQFQIVIRTLAGNSETFFFAVDVI